MCALAWYCHPWYNPKKLSSYCQYLVQNPLYPYHVLPSHSIWRHVRGAGLRIYWRNSPVTVYTPVWTNTGRIGVPNWRVVQEECIIALSSWYFYLLSEFNKSFHISKNQNEYELFFNNHKPDENRHWDLLLQVKGTERTIMGIWNTSGSLWWVHR